MAGLDLYTMVRMEDGGELRARDIRQWDGIIECGYKGRLSGPSTVLFTERHYAGLRRYLFETEDGGTIELIAADNLPVLRRTSDGFDWADLKDWGLGDLAACFAPGAKRGDAPGLAMLREVGVDKYDIAVSLSVDDDSRLFVLGNGLVVRGD